MAGVLLVLLVACGMEPTETAPLPATSSGAEPSAADPDSGADGDGQPLAPDPAAEFTIGDMVRLSGGEFVGEQADLVVEEAVLLEASGTSPHYAFLVEITGLDPETFPYNLRDFSLFDDQAFAYQPLFEGGAGPRLEFGDLAPHQRVRGWLTFEGPADSAYLELVYAPALALEPARVRVLVP
jgi:hypothetical protein